MEALPYIVQIAFFGAAGTSFVVAHLKNQAARDIAEGRPPAERWRVFRHPHRPDAPPEQASALRRTAGLHTAFGFAFLGVAMAAPPVFHFLHLGA